MSDDIEGLVETSANLATLKLDADELSILVSQRSSVPSQLDAESEKVNAAARLAGGSVSYENEYPSWTPNMESKLLDRAKRVFAEVTGTEPAVEAIHAGLEAGVIGAKHDGMDMISIGPTIEGAHSPDERLYVPSLERIWRVLVALLTSFA
jgi:dipeptidase D